MAFNSTRYMREYMKQKRADGVYPTNWRQHKKSKKIWYKILHNFFGFNFALGVLATTVFPLAPAAFFFLAVLALSAFVRP